MTIKTRLAKALGIGMLAAAVAIGPATGAIARPKQNKQTVIGHPEKGKRPGLKPHNGPVNKGKRPGLKPHNGPVNKGK